MLVRGIADASRDRRLADLRELRELRGAIGDRYWHDGLTADALTRMDAELQATAGEWDALAPGEDLTRTWPA